jgi:hypothetical protein
MIYQNNEVSKVRLKFNKIDPHWSRCLQLNQWNDNNTPKNGAQRNPKIYPFFAGGSRLALISIQLLNQRVLEGGSFTGYKVAEA